MIVFFLLYCVLVIIVIFLFFVCFMSFFFYLIECLNCVNFGYICGYKIWIMGLFFCNLEKEKNVFFKNWFEYLIFLLNY